MAEDFDWCNCCLCCFDRSEWTDNEGLLLYAQLSGGEMIFMEKGHCYVGLPGSKKSEELSRVSYTGRPQKLSDTKDVSDTYKTVLWTFVSVDQGRWVGVHFLNRSFLVQTSGFTKAEKKSLDHYKYVAGKPYFVFKNNGSSWNYPEEYQEKAKENLLQKPSK